MIDKAKRQFNEDENPNKINFVKYIQQTYIAEDKREPLTDEILNGARPNGTNRKYAAWFNKHITKHLHPDGYKTEPLAKQIEMKEVSSIGNKLVNKLKGLG